MKPNFFILAFLLAISSCKKTIINNDAIINNKPLSQKEQQALSPEDVIKTLKEGNTIFVNSTITVRDNSIDYRKSSIYQHYPEAVILSCIDSRVPIEDIFHKGLGDLFVIRVAGNTVNEDVIGNLEFACEKNGSKVILILGHEYCSAIKSNLEGNTTGYTNTTLQRINPAITQAKKVFKTNQSPRNPRFMDEISKQNVINSIKLIRQHSKILNQLEKKNQIKIIGGIYDMKTGKVNFI